MSPSMSAFVGAMLRRQSAIAGMSRRRLFSFDVLSMHILKIRCVERAGKMAWPAAGYQYHHDIATARHGRRQC